MVELFVFLCYHFVIAFLCITLQSGKIIDAKQTRIARESAPKICRIDGPNPANQANQLQQYAHSYL